MLENTSEVSKLSTVLASRIPNHEKLHSKFSNAAKVCKYSVSHERTSLNVI